MIEKRVVEIYTPKIASNQTGRGCHQKNIYESYHESYKFIFPISRCEPPTAEKTIVSGWGLTQTYHSSWAKFGGSLGDGGRF